MLITDLKLVFVFFTSGRLISGSLRPILTVYECKWSAGLGPRWLKSMTGSSEGLGTSSTRTLLLGGALRFEV
jgi:hypothetical protein